MRKLLPLLLWLTFAGSLTAQPPPQLGLRGWFAHGQTWLVWTNTLIANRTDYYEIYAAPGPFTNIAQATRVGRVLPDDWAATRLKEVGRALNWRVPTNNTGYLRLADDEALFAFTPIAAGSLHFAVVKSGQTAVGNSNRTAAIAQSLTPIRPHIQSNNVNTNWNFIDLAFWVYGHADPTAARADTPVMANEHSAGTAHLFRLYWPAGLDTNTPAPAVIFLHGTDGTWLGQKPWENGNMSVAPTNGYFVTFDDNLWARVSNTASGVNDEQTKWFGYWEDFDRFDTNRVVPTNGVMVSYTLRRNAWLTEWLLQTFNIDSNRVVLSGHSMGANGGDVGLRARPELYSAGILFEGNTFLTVPDNTVFLLGQPVDNLPTDLLDPVTALPLGADEIFNPWRRLSTNDFPFHTLVYGVSDPTSLWKDAQRVTGRKPFAIAMLSTNRVGAVVDWDERGHKVDEWCCHWAGPDTNVFDGTPRHTGQYATRFRRDQSYPAFSFDTHPASSTAEEVPCIEFNEMQQRWIEVPCAGNYTNWGTQGGYYDWDQATLTDTATNWALTLWMIGASSYANDVPAFTTATTDLSIRRPQQFKPSPGTPLNWCLTRLSDGAVLQAGATTPDTNGLVTIPALALFRDPTRIRLQIWRAGSVIVPVNFLTIAAVTNAVPARVDLVVNGSVGQCFLLETSTNLTAWQVRSTNSLLSVPLTLTEPLGLGLKFFRTRQNIRHHLPLRFRALRAGVVETHAHRAGFHVASADDGHRWHSHTRPTFPDFAARSIRSTDSFISGVCWIEFGSRRRFES
ncbi:MAG: esterase family protein [Verrucomicrobiales bacterium]|nr:esterase family protein [Verrucomicrobiales bacterium]